MEKVEFGLGLEPSQFFFFKTPLNVGYMNKDPNRVQIHGPCSLIEAINSWPPLKHPLSSPNPTYKYPPTPPFQDTTSK